MKESANRTQNDVPFARQLMCPLDASPDEVAVQVVRGELVAGNLWRLPRDSVWLLQLKTVQAESGRVALLTELAAKTWRACHRGSARAPEEVRAYLLNCEHVAQQRSGQAVVCIWRERGAVFLLDVALPASVAA